LAAVQGAHIAATLALPYWYVLSFTEESMSNMEPNDRNPAGEESIPMAASQDLTLLDVIQAVSEVAENDREIIATVAHLISSGQVRLSDDALEAIRHLLATADAAA
jgi:hypothetical protein